MENDARAATPKSARKRIFSRSPEDSSSNNSSLGRMSPLSESSEQHSSPPSSPNWVFETPRKSTLKIRSTLFGPFNYIAQTPQNKSCNSFEDLYREIPDTFLPNVANEATMNTEIVAETPSKNPGYEGFVTPFKCLMRKSLQQTPKPYSQETSNGGTSALIPVKLFPRAKPQACDSEGKPSSPLTPTTFYGSRARTSLFQRKCMSAGRLDTSSCNRTKCKKLVHPEISLISRHQSISKRLKVGEINVGVHHGIRRNKFKVHKKKTDTVKHPKITPSQRIELYVNELCNIEQPQTDIVIDPTKRFFKTGRPLRSENSSSVKANFGKLTGKSKSSEAEKSASFDDKSTTEITQNEVQNNVKVLLHKLEDSPQKEDMQNQHISAITSHTSSLALNDGGPWRQELHSISATDIKLQNSENIAPVKSDVKVETNVKKYFPVFYKTQGNRKELKDSADVRSSRGIKRPLKRISDDQYIIDAGQKKFGAIQCFDCGLVYHCGDPEDEIAHEKFHMNCRVLRYFPWKQERVVHYYGSERVILVKAGDPKAWISKVAEIVQIVDQELGYAAKGVGNLENCQVYLYVTDKQVMGCLVVHSIVAAYKMLSSLDEDCDICSEESYPVMCGISRIWVEEKCRRKRIATRLVDSMRSSFAMGHVLGVNEFAFSAPTAAGKAFAVQYTMTENFFVYT